MGVLARLLLTRVAKLVLLIRPRKRMAPLLLLVWLTTTQKQPLSPAMMATNRPLLDVLFATLLIRDTPLLGARGRGLQLFAALLGLALGVGALLAMGAGALLSLLLLFVQVAIEKLYTTISVVSNMANPWTTPPPPTAAASSPGGASGPWSW